MVGSGVGCGWVRLGWGVWVGGTWVVRGLRGEVGGSVGGCVVECQLDCIWQQEQVPHTEQAHLSTEATVIFVGLLYHICWIEVSPALLHTQTTVVQ